MTTTDLRPLLHGPKPMHLASITTVTQTTLQELPHLSAWVRYVFSVASQIKWGSLVIVLPDGKGYRFKSAAPGPEGLLEVHDLNFARRLIRSGSLGFSEAYLAREWDSPNLTHLLEVFAKNVEHIRASLKAKRFVRSYQNLQHLLHRNSKSGSKRNIHAHYDLGNEFYLKWLDPSMTYSSAKFNSPNETLSQAQRNKYEALAKTMDLRAGNTVLEIGCGWGGFAEFAATEYDCNVTGITISKEQLEYARARIVSVGLADRVELRFQDYRDVKEQFDRVASIEMFEAVGENYWPTYFGKIRDVLKPGGKAGLQIITITDRYFEDYRKNADFIQRYVFPGGMLPSPSALIDEVKRAGLEWKDNTDFGLDYARTLNRWRSSFFAEWPQIREMGFDDRFKRIWNFYLSYCEAGFRSGNIDVTQISLSKPMVIT